MKKKWNIVSLELSVSVVRAEVKNAKPLFGLDDDSITIVFDALCERTAKGWQIPKKGMPGSVRSMLNDWYADGLRMSVNAHLINQQSV